MTGGEVTVREAVEAGLGDSAKGMEMELLKEIEAKHTKEKRPEFKPGDTVRVHLKVVEGTRERIQIFEGTVTRRKGSGPNEMVTVRRVAFGEGVERIFPVSSPKVAKVEVVAESKVGRANLNYLRKRVGKAAKVKTKRRT